MLLLITQPHSHTRPTFKVPNDPPSKKNRSFHHKFEYNQQLSFSPRGPPYIRLHINTPDQPLTMESLLAKRLGFCLVSYAMTFIKQHLLDNATQQWSPFGQYIFAPSVAVHCVFFCATLCCVCLACFFFARLFGWCGCVMWLLACFWGLWVWLDGSGVGCWGVLVVGWEGDVEWSRRRLVEQTWEKDLSLMFEQMLNSQGANDTITR